MTGGAGPAEVLGACIVEGQGPQVQVRPVQPHICGIISHIYRAPGPLCTALIINDTHRNCNPKILQSGWPKLFIDCNCWASGGDGDEGWVGGLVDGRVDDREVVQVDSCRASRGST